MASRSNLKLATPIRRAWSPPVRAFQSAEGEGKVCKIFIDLSGFRSEDMATVKLRLEGDKLTITGVREIVPDPPSVYVHKRPDGFLGTTLITEKQDFSFEYLLEARDKPEDLEAYYDREAGELSIHVLGGAMDIVEDVLQGRGHDFPWRKGEPFPIEIVSPEPQQPLPPPTVLRHTVAPEKKPGYGVAMLRTTGSLPDMECAKFRFHWPQRSCRFSRQPLCVGQKAKRSLTENP